MSRGEKGINPADVRTRLGEAGLISVVQTLKQNQGKLKPGELASLGSAARTFLNLAGGQRRPMVQAEAEQNGILLEGTGIVDAPEAKAIGEGLIKEFPKDLGLLDGVPIAYFQYADALKLRGADAAAIAWIPQIQGEGWKRAIFDEALARLTGLTPSLVVIVQMQEWTVREHEQRRRLIFHELLHFRQAEGPNGEPKFTKFGEIVWKVVPHDVEQFNRVVEIFGPDEADMTHLSAAGHWSERQDR
ncbi:MAG: hypothetical protein KJ621_03290 [Proteobacteria bacterium]|nr:hypothetical protein [Pseudomonadota bacterium]